MRKYLDIPLTLIVTAVLTVAMLWPINQPPPAPDGSDKVVHLIAFAALAFPLARTGRFGLVPVLVGASVFGGMIEVIQPSFGRSADMQDGLQILQAWRLELHSHCSIAGFVGIAPEYSIVNTSPFGCRKICFGILGFGPA